MYISVKEAAQKWGISERRVRALCSQGKIPGTIREGRKWKIPENAQKPEDGRFKTNESLFERIDRKKVQLDSIRPISEEDLKQLMDDFMIEYTYNSNAIEGNTLTLRETDLVLHGLTIDKKPLKDHLEAVGHKEAFEFVQELVDDKKVLTEWDIKQIHFLVLTDRRKDRGVYRTKEVTILGALHKPTQPYLIQEEMERLLQNYNNSTDHIVKKLTQLHLGFERIHPFIDGNGRTGRLLINLELMKAGFPPIDVKYADRLKYYDAFDQYDLTGSSEAMEKLLAGYIENRLDDYLAFLK